MKMNTFEKLAMNSPIRSAFQRWYEAPLLEKLGGKTEGGAALEVGCGQGVGTREILERFRAKYVYSIDLDPDMVARAQKRLAHYPKEKLQIEVGDVTQISKPDETFNACFNFAILHHVPNWQNALKEIHRVLKPGGKFYFQDVTTHALNKWFYRVFFVHPEENRFSAQDFAEELKKQGFSLPGGLVEKYGGDFIYGVAIKSQTKIN